MRWAVVALAGVLAACSTGGDPVATEPISSTASPSTTSPATTSPPSPKPGTVAPAWLGTRPLPIAANGLGEIEPTPVELRTRRFTLPDTIDELPGTGFASRIDPVPDDVLVRSSWTVACPVTRTDLRWVRLAFWGFDDTRHTGELLVNATAADQMVKVFSQLYAAKFPLEEMRITRADELEAEPTGDGNNTSAFTCRPTTDGSGWSEHAYGLAIDVNPFQNPYVKGDVLIPELASAYLDRSRQAPGIIRAGSAAAEAFASVGWTWGGSWRRSTDSMHFSHNGQ